MLIIGASGGVGTYAVQLAKALGGHVTGVASTRNVDLVRSIGADRVIDYTREDFADGVSSYDLILDIGGRNSISRLRSVLAPEGVLVIVGGEDGNRLTGGVGRQLRAMMLSPFIKQRLTTFISKEHFTVIEASQPAPRVGCRGARHRSAIRPRGRAGGYPSDGSRRDRRQDRHRWFAAPEKLIMQ